MRFNARVICGINNIYTVEHQKKNWQCRIKGKVLRTEKKTYNPIAVGDWVEVEKDPFSDNMGWILSRRERTNAIVRWNTKRKATQVIAANADLLVCVSSAKSPPFRPRFLDRLLLSGELGLVKPIIVLNKCDLGVSSQVRERLKGYRRINYPVIYTSGTTGRGIKALSKIMKNKISVFSGQSGVGKSTLLNAIEPTLALKVGEISNKHDRGVHTTSFSMMFAGKNNSRMIDTPGVREFAVAGVRPEELWHYFPDLLPFTGDCAYYACQHIDEPDCGVAEALARGKIHPDRYESYLRIYDDLQAFQKEFHGFSFD